MAEYEELVKRLRNCTSDTVEDCHGCPYQGGYKGSYCMNGLITEAADSIEQLEATVPKWIPVTERLPEDFKAVLVYTPKFLNQFMAYHKDDGWRVWSPQDNHGVPFINGQGEITHWMPLPKPPKEND